MKTIRKIILTLALFAMCLAASTLSTYAASVVAGNISPGKWSSLIPYTNRGDSAYYRITVKTDSFLNFETKFLYSDSEIRIFDDEFSVEHYAKSGTGKYVKGKLIVSPGNYYIQCFGSFRYTFSKIPAQKANYCAAKAISLAPKKSVTFHQTPDRSYNRWFKIKLAKKKRISITTKEFSSIYANGMLEGIELYDDDMNECYLTKLNTGYISSSALAPGTYYICSADDHFMGRTFGTTCTIKWK